MQGNKIWEAIFFGVGGRLTTGALLRINFRWPLDL